MYDSCLLFKCFNTHPGNLYYKKLGKIETMEKGVYARLTLFKTNGEMKKIRVYKKVRKARKKLSTILWVEIL